MISQTSVPKTISCIVAVIPTMQLGQIVPAHVVVKVEMTPPAKVEPNTPMRSKQPALVVDAPRLEERFLVLLGRPIQMPECQPLNGNGDTAESLPTHRIHEEQAHNRDHK